MSDSHNSDVFSGVTGRGGGHEARNVAPQLSLASQKSPCPFSSISTSSSSLTLHPPSNDNPLPVLTGHACNTESTIEPSHSCDPNYHPDCRLHLLPSQRNQQHYSLPQFDLSTGLPSSRAAAPLPPYAPWDPWDPPKNYEDHPHCSHSAQQQAIASSPAAAAIADQDSLSFASTLPDTWNNRPSPATSFGSLSSTHSSNISSDTEFGGAPITPEDVDDTLRNKHHSTPHHSFTNNSFPHTLAISECDENEDDSDGGIDIFDCDMASSGPVEVVCPPSALHATVIDEDEDDFSPNNLVTRPPSPMGGTSSFFMDIFSSPSHENLNPLEDDLSNIPSFHMHLSPPLDDALDSQPNTEETSVQSVFLESNLQTPTTPSTPADIIIDSSSPDAQLSLFRGIDGLEILAGEDEELLVVESDPNHSTGSQESMHSQSSSQSPPTAAAVSISPATFAIAASEIMAAAADVRGFVPLSAHDSLHSPELPPPLAFDPPPPFHVSIADLLAEHEYEGGGFSEGDGDSSDDDEDNEDDDFDDMAANRPFLRNPPLEDIENYNKDFAKFCLHAYCRHRLNPTKFPKLSAAAANVKNMPRPEQVRREEMEENGWDYQAIPWDTLGISREEARRIRRGEYTNYENIKGLVYDENPIRIPKNRYFFNFRRMDNEQRCRLIHFQLRNLIGVISRNDVFYAGDGIVVHTNPLTSKSRTVMDLRTPDSWSGNPIRISTLGTCGGSNGVVVAGCFYGEYAMKPLHAPAVDKPITGIVTQNESGITNHVQMIRNRTKGTPNAVFSSNDHFIRVLDCGEGMKFIIEHEYSWPVNCSVTSPDSRLRVVVGDDTKVLICDAERGRTEFVLKGHRDFGFAAAWSDDGYSIATGNQDKTVHIWDARNLSKTVKVLPAVMAGVRTLRFSPIGYGGKRVLAMAEPADVVQIVDAVSWDSLQQIDFWGEVGGMDFDPSGEELYIANADRSVGGIMEFSRAKGSVYYEDYRHQKVQQHYNPERNVRQRRRKRGAFASSSDDDSEFTIFSDEELTEEEEEDVKEKLDLRNKGRYHDKRRYKRLGHDMSHVFV